VGGAVSVLISKQRAVAWMHRVLLKHLKQALKSELDLIGGFNGYAREPLHDIHKLTLKYDGSVCDKDAYITGRLDFYSLRPSPVYGYVLM